MSSKTIRVSQAAEASGLLKQVQIAFTAHQVSRNNFLNALQGFLSKIDNPTILAALLTNNVMEVLCCPLAHDPVPGIQDLGLQCLARLAAKDSTCAEAVMSCGMVDSAMISMAHESPSVEIAASSLMRALARSSHANSAKLIDAGVMTCVKQQLCHASMAVREAAVQTITALVHMGEEYAAGVLDAVVLDALMTLLQAPDIPESLTRAVVMALSSVCAYNADLARSVVAGGALHVLRTLLRKPTLHHDLKADALTCLSHIAKHDEDLAKQVTEEDIMGVAISAMADPLVPAVRRAATSLVLQISQKNPELAESMVEQGAPSAITRYLDLETSSDGQLPAVVAAGQLASFRPTIARAITAAAAHPAIIACLQRPDLGLAGRAAWALEQIAQHGTDEAMPLVHSGALLKLMDRYRQLSATSKAHAGEMDEAQLTCLARHKAAIKALLRGCSAPECLQGFVDTSTPPDMLERVLDALQPLLTMDVKARKAFVTSGALMRLQRTEGLLQDKGAELLAGINSLFPQDVVQYYRESA